MAAATRTFAPKPVIIAIEPFGGSIRDHSPQLPLVFFDDAAVTRGDGIFETLLLRKGSICQLERHMERFQRSAALLELPAPKEADWIKATQTAAEQWFAKTELDAKCVWTYTRGRPTRDPNEPHPTAWVSVEAISPEVERQREEGLKVLTAPKGYRMESTQDDVPWLKVGAKTLNYATNMAALRWARAQGYDDVIFTEGDLVLEGTTSTVVAFKGKKLRTPAAPGLLLGTTQAALFEHAEAKGYQCKAKAMTVEDLEKADSVWLVSSVRIGARVRKIGDKKLPKCENEAEIKELIEQSLI